MIHILWDISSTIYLYCFMLLNIFRRKLRQINHLILLLAFSSQTFLDPKLFKKNTIQLFDSEVEQLGVLAGLITQRSEEVNKIRSCDCRIQILPSLPFYSFIIFIFFFPNPNFFKILWLICTNNI